MAAIRPGRPAAKKQAAAPAAEAPPPPPPAAPKSRGMTVPAIVVAVALLGAAFMLKGGGGGDNAAQTAATTATSEPLVEGEVVALDPFTMNLAGGDILKVGIALQLSATADAAKALEDPAAFGARALDEAISVLGQYTREQLAGHGIADAKAKLSSRVALLYHEDVTGVYFTQFVIA
jgi:flagellar protein FliL